jgi:hypothetical protein
MNIRVKTMSTNILFTKRGSVDREEKWSSYHLEKGDHFRVTMENTLVTGSWYYGFRKIINLSTGLFNNVNSMPIMVTMPIMLIKRFLIIVD